LSARAVELLSSAPELKSRASELPSSAPELLHLLLSRAGRPSLAAQVYDLVSAPRGLSPDLSRLPSGLAGGRVKGQGSIDGSTQPLLQRSAGASGDGGSSLSGGSVGGAAEGLAPSQEQWAEVFEYARAFSRYSRDAEAYRREECSRQLAELEDAETESEAGEEGAGRELAAGAAGSAAGPAEGQQQQLLLQQQEEEQQQQQEGGPGRSGPVGEGTEPGPDEQQGGTSFSHQLLASLQVLTAGGAPGAGLPRGRPNAPSNGGCDGAAPQLTPRTRHMAEGAPASRCPALQDCRCAGRATSGPLPAAELGWAELGWAERRLASTLAGGVMTGSANGELVLMPGRRPSSARPGSARPGSARPGSARPSSARPAAAGPAPCESLLRGFGSMATRCPEEPKQQLEEELQQQEEGASRSHALTPALKLAFMGPGSQHHRQQRPLSAAPRAAARHTHFSLEPDRICSYEQPVSSDTEPGARLSDLPDILEQQQGQGQGHLRGSLRCLQLAALAAPCAAPSPGLNLLPRWPAE
jgi:hypothetical protein